MTIKNKKYLHFSKEGGFIDFITEDKLKRALENISNNKTRTRKYKTESRALLIALYYTGGRPIEILNLKGKDITKDQNIIKIYIKPHKRGKARQLEFTNKGYIKELYNFAITCFPDQFIFYNHWSKYQRNGQPEITNKLRHYFKHWFEFDEIPPYYLRHNRFSKLMASGIDVDTIRIWKGARRNDGVYPYLHMSKAKTSKVRRTKGALE